MLFVMCAYCLGILMGLTLAWFYYEIKYGNGGGIDAKEKEHR